MALKFLGDDPACGWDDQAIEAIEYAKSFGVRISNNSWARPASAPPFGDPADDVPLYEAIEDSGMLFVAAAGNSGQDLDSVSRPSIPASFDLPNILSVAAVDNTGQLASFSNYGEASVDVSAPGVSIASLIPDYGVNEAGYYYLDGTSMASPTSPRSQPWSAHRRRPSSQRRPTSRSGSSTPPRTWATRAA